MEQKEPKSSDVLAQERTDLAAERTIMAADRTLMAWLRTAIAMIGVEGGYAFYIKNDKLHWVHNYVVRDYTTTLSLWSWCRRDTINCASSLR